VIYMLALTLPDRFCGHFSREFGRYVFAICGKRHAAIVTGVPVRRTKVAGHMISRALAVMPGDSRRAGSAPSPPPSGRAWKLQVIAAGGAAAPISPRNWAPPSAP